MSDKQLRGCILGALSEAEIKDPSELTSLRCYGLNITTLGGIESLQNLKVLELQDNDISDLEPLASLYRLRKLKIGENPIRDIAPIARLADLRSLYLHEIPVEVDLSTLSSLGKLHELYLWDNSLTGEAAIASFPSLTHLELSDTGLTDIGFLDNLAKPESLKKLWLSSNGITDIEPLRRLTGLEGLFLNDNLITDLSPLEEMDRLTFLDLRHSIRLEDISSLGKMENLERANLSNSPGVRCGSAEAVRVARPALRITGIAASCRKTEEEGPGEPAASPKEKAPGEATSPIYRWVDEKGKVHFGDKPPGR